MNAKLVTNLRHVVRILVRVFVVVIVACVLANVFYQLLAMTFSPGQWARFFDDPGEYMLALRGQRVIWWLAIAGALWLAQNWLARLVIPRSPRTCSECGYDVRGLKSARCPECGFEVSSNAARPVAVKSAS